MVRSETKAPTNPDPGLDMIAMEAAGKFLLALLRVVVHLAWWALLFPMLSLPTGLVTYVAITAGKPPAIAAGTAAVLVLVGWRLTHPRSFRRLVTRRIRRRWRRWARYRRRWPELCALHGLTAVLDDRVLVPGIGRIRSSVTSDVLPVRLLPGQTPQDWQARAGALANAFGADEVRIRPVAPGRIVLDVHHTDPLAKPVPLSAVGARRAVDLERLPVGQTENGDPWQLRLRGRHLLVAGSTGAGKGSVLWSLTAALGPALRSGVVQLWVIDPKGGMEFGAGGPLFARFAHDLGEQTLGLLRDAVWCLTTRAARLRGITRLHEPSVADPLIVVVIDELATLTAYGDRKVRAEIEQLLGLLLSQGRAVGVSVVAAVQDPSKDVVALRQLFPTRVALRLAEPSQAAMVLGEGARDRGAVCDLIPDTLPGVGYVAEDGSAEVVRVRAFHVTDADIDEIVARYAPVAAS